MHAQHEIMFKPVQFFHEDQENKNLKDHFGFGTIATRVKSGTSCDLKIMKGLNYSYKYDGGNDQGIASRHKW